MKKLVFFLALLIIPCTAFGLERLSDTTMDDITGQAGVSVAVDDIQIFMNIEKMAWIDCDGLNSREGKGTCGRAGGALVLNNFQLDVLNINAILGTSTIGTVNNGLDLISTSCGDIPLFYNYATSAVGDGCQLAGLSGQNLGLNNYNDGHGSNSAFIPHFLTIDVTDRLLALSEGIVYKLLNPWTQPSVIAGGGVSPGGAFPTIGGVLIGVPTVEIYINEMSFTRLYDVDLSTGASTAANDDDIVDAKGNAKTFGTICMQSVTFTTLSGWIEIAPK